MSQQRFTPEFKEEAVRQIVDRGHSVADVSARLGVSAHTIGVLSGVLLIALGAVWAQFRLSAGQARLHHGAWLYSSYINWFACLLGARSAPAGPRRWWRARSPRCW